MLHSILNLKTKVCIILTTASHYEKTKTGLSQPGLDNVLSLLNTLSLGTKVSSVPLTCCAAVTRQTLDNAFEYALITAGRTSYQSPRQKYTTVYIAAWQRWHDWLHRFSPLLVAKQTWFLITSASYSSVMVIIIFRLMSSCLVYMLLLLQH